MQSKSWKSLLFAVFLAPSGVSLFGMGVTRAWAANLDTLNNPQDDLVSKLKHLSRAQATQHPYLKPGLKVIDFSIPQLTPFELTNTKLNKKLHPHNDRLSASQGDGVLGHGEWGTDGKDSPMTPVVSRRKTRPRHWLPNGASCLKSGNPPTTLAPQCPKSAGGSPSTDTRGWSFPPTSNELRQLHSQVPPNPQPNPQPNPNTSTSPNSQHNLTQTDSPGNIQKPNTPPQLEGQPNNFPKPSSETIERLLDKPQTDYSQRLKKLQQLLQTTTQSSPESNSDDQLELGLRVRQKPQPLEQIPPPPKEQPVDKFKPVGSLQGRLGYFYTNNIFSSDVDPVKDGLMFYGLTLASAYIPLAPKTYINASIDGYLIRYGSQSIYDYNQLRFNLGVYRQLSQRMYGEIAFSNQQLFYARNNGDAFKAGDRFLNENSLRLSLGRRDPLTSKLVLDSFYEFSLNLADPNTRNRIINSLWFSLGYYVQKPLQIGLDYQVSLSNFTDRPDSRFDEFHRLFGHINYRISNNSNINLQSGITFGSSTVPSINYNGWFFSINYSFDLGQF